MDLKKALFISFMGHCFILAPVVDIGKFFPDKKTPDIQVTYYHVSPPKVESPKAVTSQVKAREAQSETPKRALPVAPPAPPKKIKSQIVKKVRPPKVAPAQQAIQQKEQIIPDSIPGTTLPNTPECMGYYNYIRHEIRRSLEKRYKPELGEGDVFVNFSLMQTGELMNLKIIREKSIEDPVLNNLACESIKDAAPFKSFPKGIDLKQISFSLTIVFKRT